MAAERQRKEHTRRRPTELSPQTSTFSHGTRSERMRLRYGDQRTREGRALQQVMDNITADLGGPTKLSGSQRVLLDTMRTKLVILFQVARYVEGQSSLVTKEGELLPVLGKNYLGYTESVRRDLLSLMDLAGKQAQQGPSLEDYLKAKENQS